MRLVWHGMEIGLEWNEVGLEWNGMEWRLSGNGNGMTHSELTSATTHLYSDDEKRHIEENCRTKGRKRGQGHQHHLGGGGGGGGGF